MSTVAFERLQQGVRTLGLSLEAGQIHALLAYQDLILKWNRVYNLTAVRAPDEMLTHHLLDSLALVPVVQRAAAGRAIRLLDVGSGAGLPGVVIAICCPQFHVDCVDTVAKKAAFIQQAAAQLKLANLRGLHARVEELAGPYDIVTSRAFASLADFTSWSAQALAADGVWLAMKGKHPADEIDAIPTGVELFHVEQLQVPGLAAERCVLWMRKTAPAAPGA